MKTIVRFGYLYFWSPALFLAPSPGPVPRSRPPALAPNLYLPALEPNLDLPAVAPNLCLLAPSPNLYLLVLVSNFLFTSSGQDFTTTATVICTVLFHWKSCFSKFVSLMAKVSPNREAAAAKEISGWLFLK